MEPRTPVTAKSRGRWLYLLGGAVLLLGIAAYAVQFSMKHLTTPWYVPILGTIGVILLIVGFLQRPTILRGLGLVLLSALCAFEWYALLSFSRVPAYTGATKAGGQIPAFSATLADGHVFTDADFRTGKPNVLLFYRGRW
jgi:hypothetical protein